MMSKNLQKQIKELSFKVLNKYSSRVAMINQLYTTGTTKHECMILELLLLGRDYDSIRKTLLFSEDGFNKILEQLYLSLKNHDKNVKLFNKLRK